MQMVLRAKVLRELGEGVWQTADGGRALAMLERTNAALGHRSIVALTKSPRLADDGHIEFYLDDAVLLNRGSGDEALVISVAGTGRGILRGSNEPERDSVARAEAIIQSEDAARIGDAEFLKACGKLQMPSSALTLAQTFLTSVREFSDDALVEGNARKWVTKPRNFLAITIQNRKKNFAVSVKTTPTLSNLRSLDVRSDRHPYVRFWLESENQIIDALRATRASFETFG